MAWMPSCELPAMRMTASLMDEIFCAPPDDDGTPAVALLIKKEPWNSRILKQGGLTTEDIPVRHHATTTLESWGECVNF